MGDAVYHAVFVVASALELPVVLLTLLALAAIVFELGAFAFELYARRRRRVGALAGTAIRARERVRGGAARGAAADLQEVAWSAAMGKALAVVALACGGAQAEAMTSKALADFDLDRERRLGVTRLLVRAGPALGLMGTLIPLSPALDGLARGNVAALTDNLRVAFSVTVLGLFIGFVAFAITLVRDRIYGQDLSDLEFIAALMTDEVTS